MKAGLDDWEEGYYIELTPENVKEMNGLLRVAKSHKKEPLYITFYFDDDEPRLSIYGKNIHIDKQQNYIRK